MNELQNFSFKGNDVRTVMIDNEPHFIGYDVATILGYSRPDNAIRNHVNEEDKLMHQVSASGQKRQMTVINESGVYDLIFDASRQGKNANIREQAKKFRHWVTNDVLPSIRKYGMYATPNTVDAMLNNPDTMIEILTRYKESQKQLQLQHDQIHQMKPKALFADSVSTSNTTILIGDLAKIIKQNGVEKMGAKRLFEWMREHHYLISRNGADYNSPTQRSMELGLFEVKETAIQHADGHTTINKTPKVTGKGQQYFINKFLGDQSA